MSIIINIPCISKLQIDSILRWKTGDSSLCEQGLLALVEKNHSFNYKLWHAEDEARREDLGPTFVYAAKRKIDGFNQQRNNYMEAIDGWLFQELKPSEEGGCPIHSETPGMIIDRLSILALKCYHMDLQCKREDVELAHRQLCQSKLDTLKQQRMQLVTCLDTLMTDVQAKTRTFRIYHQFKMYNDPALNPELYARVC